MENKIEELTQILRDSTNIVFFGGAGVSTESNIPDFRSASGLWNEKLKINLTPEQLVSH
ncbi:Sir2 family protein, partial [Clostridium sp. DSM 8431]|uniref:Sir2 family NAD-dependent protein deacetylase n=1 Tax=Clostridium sp. DSM 8431 TaxID=1761781 RepID=UPI0008EF0CBF